MTDLERADKMRTCPMEEVKELIGDRERHELSACEQNALYDRLRGLSSELRLPVIIPTFRAQILDKKTLATVYDTGERPSYSATRNWWNKISAMWQFLFAGVTAGATTWGDGFLSIKKQTGETKTAAGIYTYESRRYGKYGYRALKGAVSIGIIIGSKDQAEAFTDYIVASMIQPGSLTGQLAYGSCAGIMTFQSATIPIRKLEFNRAFSNLSSAPVQVREAVLYNRQQGNAGIANTGLCTFRDVLSQVATVGAGQLLRLSYLFQMNYPSGV